MAILEIPVRSDLASYSFLIELDGAKYTLAFHFNTRLGLWCMDIGKSDGTEVVNGIPVQTNVDIAGRFASGDKPPGLFLAYDESGNKLDADRDTFGNSVKLLYQEVNA